MTVDDWHDFLQQWSHDVLQLAPDIRDDLPADAVRSGWLGYPGATEEQINTAESRLGISFPSSYRGFLAASNGFLWLSPFAGQIWSSEEVEWLVVRNQGLIDAWSGAESVSDEDYTVYGAGQSPLIRPEYLRTALEISDWGDGALYLLNPQVVAADGEWEAWFFANWLPGARRYRSFWEMMQRERERNLDLLRATAGQ